MDTQMEDVQLQIRSHDHLPTLIAPREPPTLDQRIAQGDKFRQAKRKLETHLKSIDQFYATPEAGIHTGQPDCNRCVSKKRQIQQAYRYYYLGSDSGRWDADLTQYRAEIERMFDDPEKYPLEQIHAFQQRALREHLKSNLLAPHSSDGPDSNKFKRDIFNMFQSGQPTNDILTTYLETQLGRSSREQTNFLTRIEASTTPEERSKIYIDYYCKQEWFDSSEGRNLKTKYARMFGELIPHDQVIAAMRKEAAETQNEKIRNQKDKLAELQMAKSAHMKDKKRKAEKADQRNANKDLEEGNKVAGCGLPRCHREIDLREESIQCVVCDWLFRKGSNRGRVYYCSVEHADEDFDEHDRNDHRCTMDQRCFYSPLPGPPGETGAGGICQDCAESEFTSYFCSRQCYEYNLDYHRDEFHYDRNIKDKYDTLEFFKPGGDLDVAL